MGGPFTRRVHSCLKSVSQEMKTPPKYFTAKDTSWFGSDSTCECTLSVKRMEKPQSLRGYSVDIGIYTMFSGKEPTISTKRWAVKKWWSAFCGVKLCFQSWKMYTVAHLQPTSYIINHHDAIMCCTLFIQPFMRATPEKIMRLESIHSETHWIVCWS